MTTLHSNVFDYLSPSDQQLKVMEQLRGAAKNYSSAIEAAVPDGPDKTYILRRLREVAMWVNVAITRHQDGAPRT